jgi:hypothetical protein
MPAAQPIEDTDELAESVAWQLLLRWGVVFRDAYLKERLAVPWREILWALRRLEAMLVVLDRTTTFLLSGNGDLIEPDDGIVAVGSGGPFAMAAARAQSAQGWSSATKWRPRHPIWAGKVAGHDNVVTLDIGGTSADIGLAQGGKLRMKHLLDTKVGPYQAMIPMVDVDTIGAGGGWRHRVCGHSDHVSRRRRYGDVRARP